MRGQISQNADTCPHCGDVINERKQKFSLVDLIHKLSVPVVLSVAGTLITILSFFSMEGERQMEQTRKFSPTPSTRIRSNSSIAFSMSITCSRPVVFRPR
jgi:hypothetical protein